MSEKIFILASARFEAACQIDTLPKTHQAARLHGHGFKVKVSVPSRVDSGTNHANSELDPKALSIRLSAVVAPLDHQHLNPIINNPTNENIARWVADQMDMSVRDVEVLSTHKEGVKLTSKGDVEIWRQFQFEAAHRLPNVALDHPCGRMHGHGFKVVLHATQALGSAAMATDLDSLTALWETIAPQLEYACLNDIIGLENPTSEHLGAWIWAQLKPKLNVLSCVSVYETATAGCHYDGCCFRIWKDFRFESALYLREVSKDDPQRRMHGHSYLIRLHCEEKLDKVLGWTIDYGDVKAYFKPSLDRLDHACLNELKGLDEPTCLNIARWVRTQLSMPLKSLYRVDCFERPDCGAVLTF